MKYQDHTRTRNISTSVEFQWLHSGLYKQRAD